MAGTGKLWNLGRLIESHSVHVPIGSQARVCSSGKGSGWFPITQGVRQGCVMSPWLFNVFMDGIMREATEKLQGGVQLTTTKV